MLAVRGCAVSRVERKPLDDLLPPDELKRQKERRAVIRGIAWEVVFMLLVFASCVKVVSEW